VLAPGFDEHRHVFVAEPRDFAGDDRHSVLAGDPVQTRQRYRPGSSREVCCCTSARPNRRPQLNMFEIVTSLVSTAGEPGAHATAVRDVQDLLVGIHVADVAEQR